MLLNLDIFEYHLNILYRILFKKKKIVWNFIKKFNMIFHLNIIFRISFKHGISNIIQIFYFKFY